MCLLAMVMAVVSVSVVAGMPWLLGTDFILMKMDMQGNNSWLSAMHG